MSSSRFSGWTSIVLRLPLSVMIIFFLSRTGPTPRAPGTASLVLGLERRLSPSGVRVPDRLPHALRCRGNLADVVPGVAKGVDNRRCRTVDRHLADALGAKWTVLVRVLADHDIDRRRVERGWNNVVRQLAVRHAAVTHHHFLEQRVADALRGTALDLAAGQLWMDGLADLVDRRERDRCHLPRVGIDM